MSIVCIIFSIALTSPSKATKLLAKMWQVLVLKSLMQSDILLLNRVLVPKACYLLLLSVICQPQVKHVKAQLIPQL